MKIQRFAFILITLITFSYSQQQGVRIITSRDDLELSVDGILKGSGMQKDVELPVGWHTVSGKRKGGYTDYEFVKVDSGVMKTVSISDKQFKITIMLGPSFSSVGVGGGAFFGFQKIKHSVWLNLAGNDTENDFQLIYNMNIINKDFFRIGIGPSVGIEEWFE